MSGLRLRGLIGATRAELVERVGPPAAERRAGGDRWLLFQHDVGELRVRGTAGEPGESDPRVASWTLRLRRPASSLREAARRVGLWPDVAPDVGSGAAAAGAGEPLLRRALTGRDDATHSFTAILRDGRIVSLAAFDEPPEW